MNCIKCTDPTCEGKNLVNALILWFRSKSSSTHSVAALVITATGIYTATPAVHDFVDSLLKYHTHAAALLAALVVIAAKFSHSTTQPVQSTLVQP